MTAQELKNAILQLAVTGQLVPQDPSGEPASDLVKRIRAEKNRLQKAGKIKKEKELPEIEEDEIPFEIPENWTWVRIEKITYTVGNKSNQILAKNVLKEGKYPAVSQGKELIDGYCNDKSKVISNLPLIMFGDHTRNVKYIDFPFVISADGTKFFKVVLGNTRYFYYVIKLYAELLRNRGYARHYTLLKEQLLPLPPLAEQKRIVERIEGLLPLVEEYGAAETEIRTLDAAFPDALRKAVLQDAVCGRLVPQDPSDEPAADLVKRIRAEKNRLQKAGKIKKEKELPEIEEDEIPFEIPENWTWVRLGEVFQHNTGKALNSSNTEGTLLTYITTSNLYWGRFELDKLKQMPFTDSEILKCSVRKGDLLVCEGGDYGRAAIWTYDYQMRVQNHIHRLRSYMPLEIKYFYYIFYFYKNTGKINGKGVAIQGLSSNVLHSLLIPLPPLAEQKRIVDRIEELMKMISEFDEGTGKA